jgi:hypothetical protein
VGNFEFRLADALSLAEVINRLFESKLPDPQIIPEDDGDIAMEWYADKHSLVNVWCRDGHVSWSGIHEGRASHGRSESTEVKISSELQSLLRAVVGKMNAVSESV